MTEPTPPAVLILDGDASRRQRLGEALERRGYRALAAGSVSEALAALAGGADPRALVLEQRVRDGNACDVLDRVRRQPRPLVVVHGAWSGSGRRCPRGIDVQLPHPLDERSLLEIVQQLVPGAEPCRLPAIRRGDHVLLPYADRTALHDGLWTFASCALAAGERALVACRDPDEIEELGALLERHAIDVEREERRGSLRFVTHHESYLVGDRFEPRAMIGYLRDVARETRDLGFRALRFAGEGTWIPDTPEDREAWLGYERAAEPALAGLAFTVLCAYSLERFPPELLLDALDVHPVVLHGRSACDNPRGAVGAAGPEVSPGAALARRLADTRARARAGS